MFDGFGALIVIVFVIMVVLICGTVVCGLIIVCGHIGYNMRGGELISAVRAGDTNTIERILRRGINVDATDERSYTPLMLAAERGHTDTVKLLLRYYADVNHGGENGDSALKLAQQNGHQDTVRVLKDAGALK